MPIPAAVGASTVVRSFAGFTLRMNAPMYSGRARNLTSITDTLSTDILGRQLKLQYIHHYGKNYRSLNFGYNLKTQYTNQWKIGVKAGRTSFISWLRLNKNNTYDFVS